MGGNFGEGSGGLVVGLNGLVSLIAPCIAGPDGKAQLASQSMNELRVCDSFGSFGDAMFMEIGNPVHFLNSTFRYHSKFHEY
jgi:hypothetical protein